MPLESIKQVGDVILVDSLDSLSDDFSPDRYGKVINCQVITESGQLLGRVLGFSFDIETGELISLVTGAIGVPLLGEGVLSTWEIPVDEIVSSGTDRIIVYEGAEEKLNQLSSGLLEKLGVGGSSWDNREYTKFSSNLVPVENQLLSGVDTNQETLLLEESREEEFIDENEIDDELEYVAVDDSQDNSTVKKQLYLDNDYSQENNFDNDSVPSQRITKKSSNKRPVETSNETLDIEPIDQQDLLIDQKVSNPVDIDDPW